VTDDTTFLDFSAFVLSIFSDRSHFLYFASGLPYHGKSGMGFHMAALITVIRKRSIGLFHPYRWYDIDGAAL
jgi:hypothetical protein